MGHRDVVIVGAPRSGTNMLRDVLSGLPGFSTWPCDEINLTWRKGNRNFPSDELEPRHARDEVRRYIRSQFERVRQRGGVVVEKTCATSLRVEFAREVLPDALFVLITRDGYDAAPSAMQRWTAPFDLRYTLAKARWVPPSDIGYYGTRYVANALRRRNESASSRASPVSWWGPRPHDWRDLATSRPLDEICAIQWSRCVERAREGLRALPADRVHHVVYEEFVAEPAQGLRDLLDFVGRPEAFDSRAIAEVSAGSVGKGRVALSPADRERLAGLVGSTLEGLGYAR